MTAQAVEGAEFSEGRIWVTEICAGWCLSAVNARPAAAAEVEAAAGYHQD